MFKQTDSIYKTIIMGDTTPPNPSTNSMYEYGCYFFSFVNGLNTKGYSFTPKSMNDMLMAHHAWVGPYKDYIDSSNLSKYFPTIFNNGFQKIDPWNDVPPTIDLLKPNLVVVCRVDARAIGGTGTHYVLLCGIQNGVAVINDPWTGNTEKITTRYGKYGNILGLQIFDVIPFVIAPSPPPVPPAPEPAPQPPVLPPEPPVTPPTPPVDVPVPPEPPVEPTPPIPPVEIPPTDTPASGDIPTPPASSGSTTTPSGGSIFSRIWKAFLSLFKFGR